jgi:hypothetical protein
MTADDEKLSAQAAVEAALNSANAKREEEDRAMRDVLQAVKREDETPGETAERVIMRALERGVKFQPRPK